MVIYGVCISCKARKAADLKEQAMSSFLLLHVARLIHCMLKSNSVAHPYQSSVICSKHDFYLLSELCTRLTLQQVAAYSGVIPEL